MSRSRPMKWNNFYKFWTILNCIFGTVWCVALLAVLCIYSFGIDLISSFIMFFDTSVLEAGITLIIKFLASGLIFLILSYATVPALNRYNPSGLIRIYIQTLAAAVNHICKMVFLKDFFDVLMRNMSLNLDNIDIALYTIFLLFFFIRIVIFLIGIIYYFKRKKHKKNNEY